MDDYAKLYEVFQKDIFQAGLSIDGFPIIVNPAADPLMPQYERGFTHLVTREDDTGLRTIDYDRACKLHWVPLVIANHKEPEVRSFWYQTPRGETLYLWLHELDHVIILRWTSKSKQRKILLSAYNVDQYKRRYFERLYKNASRILA